ncbi:MAG TPA: TonB-dependent receptor plug domain-containing protein, partial [Chitinophagaceae bacterium]
TDGNNTYGKAKPKTGTAMVYAVNTSTSANLAILNDIVGASGGKLIELNKRTISEAIQVNSRAENWLLNIRSASGKTIVEQEFPARINEPLLINGTMQPGVDTLYFHYGNNNTITRTETVVINSNKECIASSVDRISMLDRFDRMIRAGNWETILDFGLNEKVVTPNTAYIVLERVEDYVKYNIAPPKELEEACQQMNYVRRDTRSQRQQIKLADEYTILNGVVNAFNNRLYRWDSKENPISFSRVEYDKGKLAREEPVATATNATTGAVANSLMGSASGLILDRESSLNEVVVVGYGTTRKRSMTGSVSYIQSNEIWPHQTVEQALQGRVAGLMVNNVNPGYGDLSTITIRGASSLGGNAQPLFVLDGIPVSGNINNLINTSDIDNITVLKDATATALYGGRGANGVIVITSKKGKQQYSNNNRPYRLKDMEDVEYLQQIKEVGKDEKMMLYLQLQPRYEDEPGFYLDIAQHFFDSGMKEEAMEICMTAIEISNGSFQVLRAVGYILEHFKQFDAAVLIYEQLRDDYPDNLYSHRDLAWAYYQDGRYQEAMETMYAAIKRDTRQQEWMNLSVKTVLLAEMNTIISLHKNELDIKAIPASLIKPITADLRIVLDCNKGNLGYITVKEPGGEICSNQSVTKNGGMLMNSYMYGYYNHPSEYQLKTAISGKYRIGVNYYSYYSYPGKIPTYIRVMTFKNFGKPGQSISIENVVMDNQYGEIEIAEVKW